MAVVKVPATELEHMAGETGVSVKTCVVVLQAWLRRAHRFPPEEGELFQGGDKLVIEEMFTRREIAPRAAVKLPIPPDFHISKETRDWAFERLLTYAKVDQELAQFVDYHRSKGSRFADAELAFRTWVRNAVKWHPPTNDRPPSSTREQAERTRPR